MSCSSGGVGVVGIALSLSCAHTLTQDDSGECTFGWDAGTLEHWLESLLPNFPGTVGNRMRVEPL